MTYPVTSPAPTSMPTDPGHEFPTSSSNSAGRVSRIRSGSRIREPITDAGFVANYADHPYRDHVEQPEPAHCGRVRRGHGVLRHPDAAARDLPARDGVRRVRPVVLVRFPGLPGPTASSSTARRRAAGPTAPTSRRTSLGWLTPGGGFTYPSGSSIYDSSGQRPGSEWRVYADERATPSEPSLRWQL